MKQTIILLITVLISISTFAQQGINYKAVIKDSNNNLISNQEIDIKFSIIEDMSLITVYTEDHPDILTDTNGIIILNIGEGNSTDSFENINWASDTHSLKIEIDIEDDGTFEDLGTTPFKSVPYAKHAKSANFRTQNNVTSNSPGNLDNDNFVFGSSQLDHSEPDEGPIDNRFFFDISKGAFRAGGTQSAILINATDGGSWNTTNVGFHSFATGLNSRASGTNSFAAGERTFATGTRATSFGFFTSASAPDSFSIGSNTNASASQSFSSGNNTTASGYSSLSAGYNTRAYSLAETVFGLYNTSYTIGSSGTQIANPLDRLFVIGNGTFGSRSDALIVLKNGTITAPSLDLSEITDNKSLISKEYGDANYFQDISFNEGTKDLSISNGSIVNLSTINSGLEVIDEGNGLGLRVIDRNPANYGNLGLEAVDLSLSILPSSTLGATGQLSFCAGQQTTASAPYATALGNNTIASSAGSLVTGFYNSENPQALFIVGNGGTNSNRNNAFTIENNGNAKFDAEVQTTATGNANMIPIAYGTIESNGNILTGTGNFNASVSSNVFTIDVNGVTLSQNNTVCSITPFSTASRNSSIIVSGGDLDVRIFNSSGSLTATTFQFVIYKL